MVGGLVGEVKDGETTGALWIIGKRLDRVTHGYKATSTAVLLVELHRTVRRVGIMHVCNSKCKIRWKNLHVEHEREAIDGGVYTMYTKFDGYPPHAG